MDALNTRKTFSTSTRPIGKWKVENVSSTRFRFFPRGRQWKGKQRGRLNISAGDQACSGGVGARRRLL